jgi:transketolase
MAAHKFQLDNLCAIVDQNGYQQTGATAEVMDLRPLADKFAAFGWAALDVNGHDLKEVMDAFATAQKTKGRPTAIIAHTIKGYPIQTILTKDPNHHGKPLTKEEADKAIALIGA